MRKKKLYISEKILDSDDFVTGFGGMELAISAVALVIALIVGVTIYQISDNVMTALLVGAGIVIITVVTVHRDMSNENMLKKVKLLIKTARSQKKYLYQYTNIYEDTLYEHTDKE